MKIAKSSPSQMKKAMAIADCDDTVYSYTFTGGAWSLKDHKYRGDSDFFKGYLSSDCATVAIPSLGGKF